MCTLENVFIRIAKQAKDPEAIKEAQAGAAAPASQVNEISTHGGSEGTRLGADPLPDTEGLLTDHLQFRGTPFGTQFKALFLKNVTSQKRQPGVNCCVLLLTALMT